MPIKLITAPAVEPITLGAARHFLNLDASIGVDDDALIGSFISVARAHAEHLTRRAFVYQTLELHLDVFPCGDIVLPRPPLASVDFIKYKDADGVLVLLDAAKYQVDSVCEPGRIRPAYNEAWPSSSFRNDFSNVQVRYVAGYAPVAGSPTDYASGVPEAVKQWMRVRLSTSNEFREAVITGTIVAELRRDFVDGLLDPFCVDVF